MYNQIFKNEFLNVRKFLKLAKYFETYCHPKSQNYTQLICFKCINNQMSILSITIQRLRDITKKFVKHLLKNKKISFCKKKKKESNKKRR